MKQSTPVILAVVCPKSDKLVTLASCEKCEHSKNAILKKRYGAVNTSEDRYSTGQTFICGFDLQFHQKDPLPTVGMGQLSFNTLDKKLDIIIQQTAQKQGPAMNNPKASDPAGADSPAKLVDPKGIIFDMETSSFMAMLNSINFYALSIISSSKKPDRVHIEIKETRQQKGKECTCPSCTTKLIAAANAKPQTEEERKAKWRADVKANNFRRQEVIELAKKVIRTLMYRNDIKVQVDREARNVQAFLYPKNPIGEPAAIKIAAANCSPTDTFNVYIGKAIALLRLLGMTDGEHKKIYRQLIHAPQPWLTAENINSNEFRGAVFLMKNGVLKFGSGVNYWPLEPKYARMAIIIDDTDDKYIYNTNQISWAKSRSDILSASKKAGIKIK